MFKKILCPVDFSQFTQEVINYALDLAKKYGAELHLMHVVPNMTYFTPYESFLTPENLVAIEKNIQDEVERDFAKLLKGNGVPTKTVIRTGVPFVEIIDYAKSESIDLIVMGTHGRSAIENILIGNVAEKVVRKSPCPVMTIRPKGKEFKMP
ncbi:MAG: universal stress protein [Syntrophorhabdaceae bacterium]|nr:universal stress protein [Syntrophorhabdaceae bacterium]MDD4194850.1 universal stress protein [Syntrophorhabdaceae bacterium]